MSYYKNIYLIISSNYFEYKKLCQTKLNGWLEKNEKCYAISINKENTLIIVGSNCRIKVYKFNHDSQQIKEIQILKEHYDDVTTLNFLKRFLIHIYLGLGIPQSLFGKQLFKTEMDFTSQIISTCKSNNLFNPQSIDDLILSGSGDKTIKFWSYNTDETKIFCQQTISEHNDWVYSLSIVHTGILRKAFINKVISCGHDQQILIIELSKDSQIWIVIQKILTQYFGYRLSFISEDLFSFQPRNQSYLKVYKLNKVLRQYVKIQCIQIQGGDQSCVSQFPSTYCFAQCILLNKNGRYLNLVTLNQYEDKVEFQLQQSIKMNDYFAFGTMSENGNYLIFWDDQSKNISIYAQTVLNKKIEK